MKPVKWGAVFAVVGLALAGCTTVRDVSVSSDGTPGNGDSAGPAVDGTGRRIAFSSFASNLAPGDTNGQYDVFLRDRAAGTTQRVSLGNSGAQLSDGSGGADVSDNGRYVVFGSKAVPGFTQLYLRDRTAGTTILVSHTAAGDPADRGADGLEISPDGSMVVFASDSTDLPGAPGSGWSVYLFRRATGAITKIATAPDCPVNYISYGIDDPTIAWATNRFAFVQLCSAGTEGEEADLYTGTVGSSTLTNLATVHDEGAAIDARWADDGSVLAWSESQSCSRCFSESARLKTWEPGHAVQTLATPFGAFGVAVSGDGRYLAYERKEGDSSDGFYLGHLQIDVIDRTTGRHVTVSRNLQGGDGNADSQDPAFSTDGSLLAFDSFASDLVPNDRNNREDVFVTSVPDLFAGTATTSAVSR